MPQVISCGRIWLIFCSPVLLISPRPPQNYLANPCRGPDPRLGTTELNDEVSMSSLLTPSYLQPGSTQNFDFLANTYANRESHQPEKYCNIVKAEKS